MADGLSITQLFNTNAGTSLGYADVLLMPRYLDFATSEVDLSSHITRKIRLNIPMISSPMDTVTESPMAIAMALNGGIGIIHCNNTIAEQVAHVTQVKRYRNGIVSDPITVKPDDTLATVFDMLSKCHFSCFPVVDEVNRNLVGIVSKGDIELVENTDTLVREVMCPFSKLVYVEEGTPIDKIHEVLRVHKVKRIPIVKKISETNTVELVGLVCRKDVRESKVHPLASINPETGRLLVGASVTTHPRDRQRISALIAAGVDVIVIDSATGASSFQLETLKWIKSGAAPVEVICGNVVTQEQAHILINAGADALRVGMGVGSICTTQGVCGVGRGQASSVYWTSQLGKDRGVPIIADGGISESGDIIKALVLGASAVMMGRIMAECDESAGETVVQNGVKVKCYRGMGAKANKNSQSARSRYGVLKESIFVAQGVEGRVPQTGSVHDVVPRLAQAVRQGFQDIGVNNMQVLRRLTREGQIRAERLSHGAQLEGQVHHLHSYEK